MQWERAPPRFYSCSSQHAGSRKHNSKHQDAMAMKNSSENKLCLWSYLFHHEPRDVLKQTIFIVIRSLCTDRTVNTPYTSGATAKACSHLNTIHSLWSGKTSLSQHLKDFPKICRETLQESLEGLRKILPSELQMVNHVPRVDFC